MYCFAIRKDKENSSDLETIELPLQLRGTLAQFRHATLKLHISNYGRLALLCTQVLLEIVGERDFRIEANHETSLRDLINDF